MAIFKCKMCGGDLDVQEGMAVSECTYCGTKQTVPAADNEKKVNLFNRANRLRINSEFDKAAGVYESIVAEFPEEAEAYWGLCLCNFGIEYVDDPATAKKIPTCHRTSYDSIFQDSNFDLACEYADSVARQIYRAEAKEIDRLQKEILDIAKNEEPFDIFICYKETAPDGQRTKDSVLAQDIYDALTDKGYKVFFARITLEDKLGQDYEPYIFSALNTAKIMLAIGTDYEHFNAVWVKNEWSRFLALMKKDKSKTLIPCYCDIDAYDMPEEFKHLQGQDMGKVGFVQDLIRGIGKIIQGDKGGAQNTVIQQPAVVQASTAEPLFKRAAMCLDDEEWKKADDLYEQILNLEPENVVAYIGKLCAELHIHRKEEISSLNAPLDESTNASYRKVLRFADDSLKKEFEGYNLTITERNENARKSAIYDNAVTEMNGAIRPLTFQHAAEMFRSLGDFKDAEQLAEKCETQMCELIYTDAYNLYTKQLNDSALKEAERLFMSIREYKNSEKMAEECRKTLQNIIQKRNEEEKKLESAYANEVQKYNYRCEGVCQYCGGLFTGLIKKVCTNCGKPKDY